jgi:hypothetical protein
MQGGASGPTTCRKNAETRFYSTSERTRSIELRHVERAGELAKEEKEVSAASRKAQRQDKCESYREDKREWVGKIAAQMDDAMKSGSSKDMARQHKRLSRGEGSMRGQPTQDGDGNRFKSIEDALRWWHSNMADHWKATDAKDDRAGLAELIQGDAGEGLGKVALSFFPRR